MPSLIHSSRTGITLVSAILGAWVTAKFMKSNWYSQSDLKKAIKRTVEQHYKATQDKNAALRNYNAALKNQIVALKNEIAALKQKLRLVGEKIKRIRETASRRSMEEFQGDYGGEEIGEVEEV